MLNEAVIIQNLQQCKWLTMSNISSLSTGVKTLSPLWAYAFFLAGCKVTVKHKACLRRDQKIA
jgi:hypothetical protein